MSLLSGKTAIVTGAASGIGAAIASRLAGDGARVILADIDGQGAIRAAADLSDAEGVRLDVRDETEVEALVTRVDAEHGLDIMVNNAGTITIGPVTETSLEDWQRLMSINLDGVFLGARAAARVMSAAALSGRPPGLIVNMASGAGRRCVPMLAGYCASKAAVISLTQSLAQELGPLGIRVNALAPGHIETPFWGAIADGFAGISGRSGPEVIEGFRSTVPMGRFGTPEEVAGAVAWLAGPDAGYVSGQTIGMNGAELPF